MPVDQIKEKIEQALEELYDNESAIITNNVSEQCITHKLAEYLSNSFNDYNVDMCYNRNIDEPKSHEGKKAIIDIIIHKRLSNEGNLVAIEIKKNSNHDSEGYRRDIEKLQAFTSSRENKGYGFELGCHLIIDIKNPENTNKIFYINGEEQDG